MKYSVKLSNAIHILTYIEMLQGTDLSSDAIAKSVNVNPVSVRKLMSQMKKNQLLESQSGKAAPKLARPPQDITLYDIYSSVEEDVQLFKVDEKTAPSCLVGGNIQKVLAKRYNQLQASVENEMKKITLLDILQDISHLENERHPFDETSQAFIQAFL